MSSAFSAEIKKLLVKLENLQCDFDDGFPVDEIAVELFDCVRELKYLIDFVMPKVAGV